MKKIVLYVLYCLSLVFFIGCSYDDLSTYDEVSPEIIIDTTGIPVKHTLKTYDVLKISPKVSKAGTSGDQFTYKWILSLIPGDDAHATVISRDRELNEPILLEPDTKTYRLWYIVTDTITSLQKDIIWEVEVSASSGQGIVVAYSNDGIDSDFDFLQSDQFSPQKANPDYQSGDPVTEFEVYFRNVYSAANDTKFKGIVKGMFFLPEEAWNGRNANFLFPYSDNSIERVNSLNYMSIQNGEEMFYDKVTIQPDYMNLSGGKPFYVGGGKVYQRKITPDWEANTRFVFPAKGNYVANEFISLAPKSAYSSRGIAFYDEVNGKFYGIGYGVTGETNVKVATEFVAKNFDPNNVKGFKVIGAGHYDSGNLHYFILRKGAETFLYSLSSTYTGTAEAIYDITAGTKIDQATDFIVCTNQNVIYYRVANEIYAIIMGALNIPKYELKYTSPEQITAVQMYKGAYEWVSAANKILFVATYTGDEGKLYALPLINMQTGNIDLTKIRTYKGFGKISFIGAQD